MPAYFELATRADDPELRRLLRETPFAGSIPLSLEREPDYFLACAVEGPFHETLVVRDDNMKRIIGIGDRSVRPLYVNGEIRQVGYFSGLRVDAQYQHGLALARFLSKGFEGQHHQHQDKRTQFYLMSIVADNEPARRLLDSKLPYYPHLQPYVRMFTYAIHPRRIKNEMQIRVLRGSPQALAAILDCLTRNGMRAQFSPYWTEDTLFSDVTPALSITDFFLAWSGERVVGCLALWDQQSFKQSVIRGYSGMIARYRRLFSLLSPIGGWPALPEPGTRLNQCFACFVAVDEDDPVVFSALLRAVYNEAARRRYDFLTLGLAEGDPFHPIVKAYRPITYESQIYLAAWSDGFDAVKAVDSRRAGLEIALL